MFSRTTFLGFLCQTMEVLTAEDMVRAMSTVKAPDEAQMLGLASIHVQKLWAVRDQLIREINRREQGDREFNVLNGIIMVELRMQFPKIDVGKGPWVYSGWQVAATHSDKPPRPETVSRLVDIGTYGCADQMRI